MTLGVNTSDDNVSDCFDSTSLPGMFDALGVLPFTPYNTVNHTYNSKM